jgi:hypothetical protein
LRSEISRYYNSTKPTDFSVIAGILRLSTKYDVGFLRQQATQHLLSVYSATLDGWDQRDSPPMIPVFQGRPFAAVRLAREIDIPIILPAAMYGCARSAIERILDGITLPDGSSIDLDWRDKRSCIIARTRLSDAILMRTFKFLDHHPSGCSTLARCAIGRLKHLRKLQAKFFNTPGPRPLTKRFLKGFEKDVCDCCYTTSHASFVAARQALWDDLPGIFGLPSWQQLRAATDVDIPS